MSEFSGNTEIKMGSERSFGIVFCIVFVIVALFPLTGDGSIRWWSLAIAAVFLGTAFVAPDVLRPLNRLWFRFGLLLNKIVSPIVMGILFFLTVTPIGLIMRLWKRDPLKQEFDAGVESYWIIVDSEHAEKSSMKNQF